MGGRRNEAARAIRRKHLKEAMSLTSVPRSEGGTATDTLTTPTTQPTTLTLDNHFGWVVLNKSQIGDGTFPYLFQYYEKPDLHGRDFDKVTYVLYMDKGTVVDKNTMQTGQKYTQTVVSGIQIPQEPYIITPPGDYYDKTQYEQTFEREVSLEKPRVSIVPEQKIENIPEQSRRKKKKIISEFYKRSRSRSRSAGHRNAGGYSDAEYREWQPPEMSNAPFSQIHYKVSEMETPAVREQNRTAEILREINNAKYQAVDNRKDCHHVKNRMQLRAGAENLEREGKDFKKENEKTSTVMKKNSSKIVEYVRRTGCAEELLKTSSGANQYLYISGKKIQRQKR